MEDVYQNYIAKYNNLQRDFKKKCDEEKKKEDEKRKKEEENRKNEEERKKLESFIVENETKFLDENFYSIFFHIFLLLVFLGFFEIFFLIVPPWMVLLFYFQLQFVLV